MLNIKDFLPGPGGGITDSAEAGNALSKHLLDTRMQQLENQFYPAKTQADIGLKNAQAQFAPLEALVNAQNALRLSGPYQAANEYLRFIEAMDPKIRLVYLANPANAKYHRDMMEQLKAGGLNQANILTTEAIQDAMQGRPITHFGTTGNTTPQTQENPEPTVNPLATTASSPYQKLPTNMTQAIKTVKNFMRETGTQNVGLPENAVTNAPENAINNLPQPFGMLLNQPEQANQLTQVPFAQTQTQQPGIQIQPNGQAGQAPEQTSPIMKQIQDQIKNNPQGFADQLKNNTPEENVALATTVAASENRGLKREELDQLSAEALANQAVVNNSAISSRAIGAATTEMQIIRNRDKYVPRIQNAFQYAGALGKGKFAVESLLQKNENARVDYLWLMNDFIPNMYQNIKVTEGLTGTIPIMKNVENMFNIAVDHMASNPRMANKLFNAAMELFRGQSQAALDAAQPTYPGVFEKMYDLKKIQGDYVPMGSYGNVKSNPNEHVLIGPDGETKLLEGAKSEIDKIVKDHPNWRLVE